MFEGGPESFLSFNGVSFISSFESLAGHLSVRTGTGYQQLIDIRAAVSNPTLTYETLFTDFLRGYGIPCPTHFAAVAGTFNSIIDLSQVNSPAFRSRMFNLAATGSPLLDVTADPIAVSVASLACSGSSCISNVVCAQVFAAGDNDSDYSPYSHRTAMANMGTLSFRTCFRTVRFPASYLVQLATAHYSPGSEPASFIDAYHSWLLIEILSSIGNHSMA